MCHRAHLAALGRRKKLRQHNRPRRLPGANRDFDLCVSVRGVSYEGQSRYVFSLFQQENISVGTLRLLGRVAHYRLCNELVGSEL